VLEIKKSSISELKNASNIQELLEEYATESAHKNMPRPDVKAEVYLALEATGILHTFISKENNNIIGYITFLITVLPHYGVPMAVTESFFVRKIDRKTGAGLRLLSAAEDYAKNAGAFGILVSAPYDGVLSKILHHSTEYSPSNVIFFRSFKC